MPTSKKPTPIRAPKPIQFPPPKSVPEDLPQPEPETQRLDPYRDSYIRQLVREEVRKALDGYSANLYHTLDRSEADIIEMGEAQFQALMRDVWRDE